MPKRAEPGRTLAWGSRWRVRFAPALLVLAAGCQERERLTFPSPGDGIGPVTTIDQPSGSDTTVGAGPDFFVTGRTVDQDGIDTVYFLVIGGKQNFPPFRPNPPTDTVEFGLPITTLGLSGDTIGVTIYGVDTLGNQGKPSARRIFVQ